MPASPTVIILNDIPMYSHSSPLPDYLRVTDINDWWHPDQAPGEWRHSSPSTSWPPRITRPTAASSTTMWVDVYIQGVITPLIVKQTLLDLPRQQAIINIRHMYWVSALRPQWVVNWGHNILATIPRLITKYWVKCHERRGAKLGLSGHKPGPVIGIHWWFTAQVPHVFSWFYRMWSLWCNDLWHLSRWPLIPRRKLEQLKAGAGCGVSPRLQTLTVRTGCSRLRPCSSNLDIYPNGEKWHEVEPEPDRVMQWQSREMMRTQSHDEQGEKTKTLNHERNCQHEFPPHHRKQKPNFNFPCFLGRCTLYCPVTDVGLQLFVTHILIVFWSTYIWYFVFRPRVTATWPWRWGVTGRWSSRGTTSTWSPAARAAGGTRRPTSPPRWASVWPRAGARSERPHTAGTTSSGQRWTRPRVRKWRLKLKLDF